MSRLLSVGLTALLIWIPGPRPTYAGEKPEIEFDILTVNDSLGVWLDLSDLVNSQIISQLKEGVQFAVKTDLALQRPRRLWGYRSIGTVDHILTIGYRSLTEDYQIRHGDNDSTGHRLFPSLAGLHRYLADSIIVSIGPLSDLDVEFYYDVQIRIAVISLTKINLVFDPDRGLGAPSMVGFLFRRFLELTGFGQEELLIRSRPFTLSEIRDQN
ncbi:MAG: DUF4390 domain-containing protein [candidate division Zixibacteria bacterium]|nr:DUF4390 domain-containing protein [candidate division Zixibacteria bacterium]